MTSKFDGRSRQLYYEAVFYWIRDSVRPNNDSAEEFGRIIFWFIWQKNFSGHNTLSAEMQKHLYFGRNELLLAERADLTGPRSDLKKLNHFNFS